MNPFKSVRIVPLLLAAIPGLSRAQVCVTHEQQKLVASDAQKNDHFGFAVATSGDWAVVGSYGNDDACSASPDCNSGSAYFLRYDDHGTPGDVSDDAWIEHMKVTALDTSRFDQFGWSVAIAGDRAVIGADLANGNNGSGAAYVFRHDDNGTPSDKTDDSWFEEARLVPSDGDVEDHFGWSVSIDGDWIIVGALTDDDACLFDPICDSGSAYVFRRDDNGTPLNAEDDSWVEEVKLTSSNATELDFFGVAVAINNGRVLVGAEQGNGLLSSSGSAYVFRRDDNGTPLDMSDDNWIEETKLLAPDGSSSDLFGESVSLSGPWAVVGAPRNENNGSNSGAAYVFQRHDNGTPNDPKDDFWTELTKLVPFDPNAGDRFGESVFLGGDKIVLGALLDDDSGNASGAAYLFERDDNNTPLDPSDDSWNEESKFTASDGGPFDVFGSSVSLWNGRVIIGSSGDDDACPKEQFCNSGAVYAFSLARPCVDLADYAEFQNCFGGNAGGVSAECERFDFRADQEINLGDYAEFWAALRDRSP